jgi:4-coumarate--CoA ligase
MMATFNSELCVWDGPKVPYAYNYNTSIGAEILNKLSETPERILHLCHDDDTSMTCHETKLASIRIAQNLTKLGYKSGDVIGFLCNNSTFLPAALYGSLMIGAVVNPLDVGFKKDDIKHIFEQTAPKLIFCDHNVYDTVKISIDEMNNNALIVTLREPINGAKHINELLATTGNEDSFE